MTHREIIMGLGGPVELAKKLAMPERRVRGWRDRDSIPAMYWSSVARVGGRKATLTMLAEACHEG